MSAEVLALPVNLSKRESNPVPAIRTLYGTDALCPEAADSNMEFDCVTVLQNVVFLDQLTIEFARAPNPGVL